MNGKLAEARVGTPAGSLIRLAALATAYPLLAWNLWRLAGVTRGLPWWLPLAVASGIACADLISGIGHWLLDTWGSEDTRLIGASILRAFRVHHSHPHDILDRSFVDLNGEIALIAAPLLSGASLLPLESVLQCFGVTVLLSCCGVGMFTNQFHKWAHMTNPAPPWPIRALQRARLILPPEHHAQHHVAPSIGHYCITAGWWDSLLGRLRLFELLERLVTAATGIRPRADQNASRTPS